MHRPRLQNLKFHKISKFTLKNPRKRSRAHPQRAGLCKGVAELYLHGGELWVKTSEPLVLKTSDFDLIANVKRLSQICMHDSVDDAVSVEVSLTFH